MFSFEAVEKLNMKPKNFKDLLTDEDFSRKDIITIQDPTNLDKFNISSFHHVKNNMKLVDEDEEKMKKNPRYTIRKANAETESTLAELAETCKEPQRAPNVDNNEMETKTNLAHYSTGAMGGSFTSTAVMPQTKQVPAKIHRDVIKYSKIKKKAYVRLQTNYGDLNLELHSDQLPKTCENFVGLCKKGYYNKGSFHRLIKNFMIQGGDPTGTGSGGQSLWGKPFEDEFRQNLVHQGRGVVSMANSGKDSNKSQFFITFRSCRHLDGKHAVFGRVVGGMDTLSALEKIETSAEDKPNEAVTIKTATVFVDPFEDADKEIEAEREQEMSDALEEQKKKDRTKINQVVKADRKVYKAGVGKYIPNKGLKRSTATEEDSDSKEAKKRSVVGGFGDFSSW